MNDNVQAVNPQSVAEWQAFGVLGLGPVLGKPGEHERKTKLDYCVTTHLRLYLGFLVHVQLCNQIDRMQNRNKNHQRRCCTRIPAPDAIAATDTCNYNNRYKLFNNDVHCLPSVCPLEVKPNLPTLTHCAWVSRIFNLFLPTIAILTHKIRCKVRIFACTTVYFQYILCKLPISPIINANSRIDGQHVTHLTKRWLAPLWNQEEGTTTPPQPNEL